MAQATASMPLRVGMADIALLAKVQRPVVSMWRKRTVGSTHPFPAPVDTENGSERFDGEDVARWLADTGHGNNREAPADVAAFATVASMSQRADRDVFDALTALLCLKAITGRVLSPLSDQQLLDLAAEHDPDDSFLLAELASMDDRCSPLARFSDLLADAAYNPAAAFERLLDDRFRSGLHDHASAAVSPVALRLAASVAVELTDRPDVPAVYVDMTPGSSDLMLAVLAEHGERSPAEIVTAPGDDAHVRLVSRRLRVHDTFRSGLRIDVDGAFAIGRPVTHVGQFPTPAAPTMSDADVLSVIESTILQMDDSQRGVVLAPASALCDGFADRAADEIRAAALRTGHIHAIVRLPQGLVPSRPRQAMALWLLGSAQYDVPAEDRFTVVADLVNVHLTDVVVDSLVTDLLAATGTRAMARAHAFRFARAVSTRQLLTARTSLVTTGATSLVRPPADVGELLVRIERTRAALDPAVPLPLGLPAVTATNHGRSGGGHRDTVGHLISAGVLRMLPGNRLDDSDLGSGTGLIVLGVPELTESSRILGRRIDPLTFAAHQAAGRVTEPGDVVFCSSPRPAAVVDWDGGSVVAFPARVLRVHDSRDAGLVPSVLVADINEQSPHARAWRLWSVRLIPADQHEPLTVAYDAIRSAEALARTRLDDLSLMARLLTDAAATEGLVLHMLDNRRRDG